MVAESRERPGACVLISTEAGGDGKLPRETSNGCWRSLGRLEETGAATAATAGGLSSLQLSLRGESLYGADHVRRSLAGPRLLVGGRVL